MVTDRINRAILGYIHRKAGTDGPVVFDGERITLMHGDRQVWSVGWAEIVSVTALQTPGWVGDTITLTIEAAGQTRFVSEVMAGWPELLAALPEQLPGGLPYEQWALALLAGGPEATVSVYEGG